MVAGNHDGLLDAEYGGPTEGAQRRGGSSSAQRSTGVILCNYLEDAVTTVTCLIGRQLRVYYVRQSALAAPRHARPANNSSALECLLVNAAMVGGLWDEERRKPVKVELYYVVIKYV